MLTDNQRRLARTPVQMNLRSASLPRYQADIVDLSQGGVRIRLRGAVSQALENQRIRFGASLTGQMGPQFEGQARVVWIRQTAAGWEAGLEWEKLSPSAWQQVSAALGQNAA